MDAKTYPNAAVRRWLKNVVPYRINVEDRERQAEVERFRVKALPTIVLLDPTGKVLYSDSGGLIGDQLMLNLAYDRYKRMIDLFNAQKFVEAAPDIAFLRRYFKDGGTPGEAAEELYDKLKDRKEFVAAYEKAVAAEDARLAPLKKRAEEEAEARRQKELMQREEDAAAKLAAANKLRVRGKRTQAIAKYEDIVRNFGETKAAKTAREKLKRLGVKVEEPEAPKEKGPEAGGDS